MQALIDQAKHASIIATSPRPCSNFVRLSGKCGLKCNVRRIVDYPNLYGYLRDLYQLPGIKETVNFDHIKRHYYMTHEEINPTRIVPIGPLQFLDTPHGRERLC
jgi:glutathionyl-hydroquinone reductase